MKQALHLCLALFAMLFVGCGYDDTALRNRIEELEKNQNMKIATLSEQIEAINKTISDLKTVNANLEERIAEVETDADANAEDIAELQEAKITLEERIATLQDYVDTELRNTEDWAEATFATLQHYYVLVDDIAALNSYVDGLDDVLKQWVNEQLDGYYTIAEVNAMLKALQDSVDENNKALQGDIDELSEKVDEMREELISAYEEAIEEAIKTNNGVIDGKIAEAIADVNDRVDSEVATINARIDALEERIDKLEKEQNAKIATLQQQIDAINSTLPQLRETDAELKEYIESLQTTATNLQGQITAANEDIGELEAALNQAIADAEASNDALKAELVAQLNATKADILAQLESAKTALEAELAQINSTIATLQTKDVELESKITALEKYVNTELQNMEDWVTGTFATLEQYNTIVEDIATIKVQIEALNTSLTKLEERLNTKIATDIAAAVEGLQGELAAKVAEITTAYTNAISTAKDDITAAYTEAIATAITTLENSMKKWVNEQLDGYYTIAEVDAALGVLQDSVDENSMALQQEIQELSAMLDMMRYEYLCAYEELITEAIYNRGVIDSKIADAIADINDRIDSEIATINARINALEYRIEDLEEALDKIKALDIVFDIESGKACMAGTSIEFGYTIVGGDEDTEVESFGDGGWRADVTAIDANSGRIRVTAPKDGGNGKVIVLATSGAGASAMKSIRFDKGVIADFSAVYHVEWEACTLMVPFKTNVDYEVRISEYAQSWLSVADTRAEMREDVLVFSVAKNTGSYMRTAVVDLVNGCGEVLQSFEIMQKQKPSSDPIQFADQYAKMVCVEK